MSRLFGRLGLIVIGLLSPLLILELIVRLLGLAPPPILNPNIWDLHPALGWFHLPNSGGTFYSSFNEFTTDVQINSLGLRDEADLNQYDLPEEYKILILADSFGEALQVPLEATFYSLVENRLTEREMPTRTINSGVGSWGTDQQASYYRLEGHRFQPNLTLLFFFTRNDVVNNHSSLEIARNGGSIQKSFYQLDEQSQLIYPEPFDPDKAYDHTEPPPPLSPAPLIETADWLWLNSALYRWLVPYVRDIPPLVLALGPSGILGGEGRVRATHPSIPVPFFVYENPPNAEWEAAWALTEAILVDLRNQVESDGGKFAVVIIPAREQVYIDEWTRTVASNADMRQREWHLELPNERLTDLLSRHSVPHLDLLPIFRESAALDNAPRLYFRRDGHWTEAGHQLTAEAVLTFIEETGLY